MEHLQEKTVRDLLEQQSEPKVTVYSPTVPDASPKDMTENRTRLKNLLQDAVQRLRISTDNEAFADRLAQQANELHEDEIFWKQQLLSGILVCASPASFRSFRLPVDTEGYVAVDRQYHLAPILDLIEYDRPFLVLSLALHGPQLFKGDLYGLVPSGTKLPDSIESALHIDELNEERVQQRSASGAGTRAGRINGRGGVTNRDDAERRQFFRLVDRAVIKSTDRSHAAYPLVLAGTESAVAEYREAGDYPNILAGSLRGNFQNTPLADIFAKAYPIVWQETMEPLRRTAFEKYARLSGAEPHLVARTDRDILQAADQGRIGTLFTAMNDNGRREGRQVLGRIVFPETHLARLLNRLAAKVWRMKGKVIAVGTGQLPDGDAMVATLRY